MPDTGTHRRLSPRVVLPGLAGLVAVVVVIALLVAGLGGGSGGASSPAAAVRALADAVHAKDPAAAIAILDPDEISSVADLYRAARADARGAQGVSGSGVPKGITVAFRDLQFKVNRLGPNVAKVNIVQGTLSTSIAAGQLPAGLRASGDSASTRDLASVENQFGGRPVSIMTRQVGGHWYVSPLLTTLEYVLAPQAAVQPDFSGDNRPAGTPTEPRTAQQLVADLAQAVSQTSLDGALGLLAEPEAGVLQPYRAALQQAVAESGGSVSVLVNNAQYAEHSLGSGFVRIDVLHLDGQASVTASGDSSATTSSVGVVLNGLCARISDAGSIQSNGCATQATQLFGIQNFFFVAKRDSAGGLRLAPLQTAIEYAKVALGRLGAVGHQFYPEHRATPSLRWGVMSGPPRAWGILSRSRSKISAALGW